MEFTDKEIAILQKKLHFLDEIDYKKINKKESIDYIKDGITISIHNKHLSDCAGILIRHTGFYEKEVDKIFHLDWFVYYFNDCNFIEYSTTMDDLLKLIDLLKMHYSEFTDVAWCENAMNIVRESLEGKLPKLF